MASFSCNHMYFPLHLRHPADLIPIWFVFRIGEEESGFGRRQAWNPHPRSSSLIASILRPATLLAPGKPRFQTFPSFHKGVLSVKGFGCSWSFLSFCLLKCILWCWNITDFFPPSSPRCFWFSGCTPVKLGHLGKMLEFYLQQRRMRSSHANV